MRSAVRLPHRAAAADSARAFLHRTRAAGGRAVARIWPIALVTLAACSAGQPSLPDREWPTPRLTIRGTEVGVCSWYGPGFHGRSTANGETYDQHALTAAHRTLPIGTRIEVTDLKSGRRVHVRVNDRGPYHDGRMCDLSYGAAEQLGVVGRGIFDAEIRVLTPVYASYPSVRYAVQLGAFQTRVDAERFARNASSRKLRPYIDATGRGATPYRVRLGPYDSRAQAAAATRDLRKRGVRAVIIEEPPTPLRTARNELPRLATAAAATR